MTSLIAFETATPSGGVALLVDDRVVGEFRVQGSQSHSTHCLRMANLLMESQRLKWEQITALAASHGPGAFTGVRVGLTIVKGLAWSLGKSVVTVNTLEAMAFGAWSGEPVELVAAVQDARMGEVYAALFRPESGRLVRVAEDRVLPPADLVAEIGGRATLLCGEGERSYAEVFAASNFVRARADRMLASPGPVALLAAEALERGQTMTASEVEAVYLRDAIQIRPSV
ncbi:tRNA (adenosine(37)-N6)-threonylcarbamoyltransferase complex dimerization subunit type 1 TsaB [bacterium]|nr:tRNA (adenosine(37)-N6)-threonylcarbamoyltransferase complex dimerization subunit type 1 TsaB [bacterium]